MAKTQNSSSPGRALGQALRAYFAVVPATQRAIVEQYVQALVDNDLDHAPRMGQRIVGASAKSPMPVPAPIMEAAIAAWDSPETKQEIYRGLVGPPGGRPKKVDSKTSLGVSRVAPDVAAAVARAPNRTVFVEQAIRYYVAHEPGPLPVQNNPEPHP